MKISRGFLARDFLSSNMLLRLLLLLLFPCKRAEHLIVYCFVMGDGGNVNISKCEKKVKSKSNTHIHVHNIRRENRENDNQTKLVSGRISHQNQDTFHVINVDIGREHVNVRM